MIINIQEKIIAVVLTVLLCLFLGWKANTIWTGYKNEKVLLQQEAVTETIRESQATIAKQFEDQKVVLQDLAGKNKSTTTKIIQQNQPIYSHVCIDDAGIAALQKYKDESNAGRKVQ